ncbi:MAG: hypothetical protein ACLVA2_00415 [Clostridia bacterium]
MAKKVIKEMIIILLLCLAIILILGLLLYDYVPTGKIIPEEVSYTTPSEIKEEINKGENVEDEQVILTYSVDSTDLKNYERINTYVPGKTNPFSSYDTSTTQGENTTTNGSQSNANGNSNNTNSGNTNSNNPTGGTYLPDKGTK